MRVDVVLYCAYFAKYSVLCNTIREKVSWLLSNIFGQFHYRSFKVIWVKKKKVIANLDCLSVWLFASLPVIKISHERMLGLSWNLIRTVAIPLLLKSIHKEAWKVSRKKKFLEIFFYFLINGSNDVFFFILISLGLLTLSIWHQLYLSANVAIVIELEQFV